MTSRSNTQPRILKVSSPHPVSHHTQWKEGCPSVTDTGSEESGDPKATWWSSSLPQGDLPLLRTTTHVLRALPHPALVPAASPGGGLLPADLLENLAVEDSAQGRAVGRGLLLCSPRPVCLQVPSQDSNLQGQRGRRLGRQKGPLSVTGPREKSPVNQDTKTSSTACKPADT